MTTGRKAPAWVEPVGWTLIVFCGLVLVVSVAAKNWWSVASMAFIIVGQSVSVWRARTGRWRSRF